MNDEDKKKIMDTYRRAEGGFDGVVVALLASPWSLAGFAMYTIAAVLLGVWLAQ